MNVKKILPVRPSIRPGASVEPNSPKPEGDNANFRKGGAQSERILLPRTDSETELKNSIMQDRERGSQTR
jgi:hypothetical protein